MAILAIPAVSQVIQSGAASGGAMACNLWPISDHGDHSTSSWLYGFRLLAPVLTS